MGTVRTEKDAVVSDGGENVLRAGGKAKEVSNQMFSECRAIKGTSFQKSE